jgi:hypothetical protein
MSDLEQYAQGDILLTVILAKDKPKGLRPVVSEQGLLILARGEATGHHHSVPASAGVLEIDEGGVMYLTIDQLTAVEHQEHAAIPLQPKTYRVDRQHEEMFGHWVRVSD